MKSIRMTEAEFQTAQKRLGRAVGGTDGKAHSQRISPAAP